VPLMNMNAAGDGESAAQQQPQDTAQISQAKILKSQLTPNVAIRNYCKADFGEISSALNSTASTGKKRRS